MKTDLYAVVTDRIVAALEQGNIPWVTPWAISPEQALPANLSSGHRYRGVNVLLLNMVRAAQGYSLNRWLTFQQARSLGGHVRKGERGTEVVFFKMLDIKDVAGATGHDGTAKVIPLLRSFTVFNAAQVDGLPESLVAPSALPDTFEPLAAAEDLLRASGAVIKHEGDGAFYRPADDTITMPGRHAFVSADAYYGVALHELTHWTAHPSRCARTLSGRQHIEAYAFEELIAEMGSAFLCGHVGIHAELQHAAYIESWLQALRNDKRLIFSAASAAQKAVDFLMPQAQGAVPAKAAEVVA